jgi:cell division septation protein DedD
LGRQLRSVGFFVSALSVVSTLSALSAQAQTDPRLVAVIREAQQGQTDSARVKVKRLLATTSPSDTLYPQILYTQAMVSSDAGDMRRQLQRVAVEHSTSSWADDALLRLVQLDYASGNLNGAARNLERIRQDYPGTNLLPQASYWAARTYFDQKNPVMACRWLTDGVAASRGNVELLNQLGYLNQRCAQVAVDTAPHAPVDSPLAVASGGDSVAPPTRSDSAAPVATDTTTRTPAPGPAQTAPARARFRIQITAVGSVSSADAIVRKLAARGFAAVTVPEGGLYKVRVGDYASKAEAAAAIPGVKAKLGGSPFVVAGP